MNAGLQTQLAVTSFGRPTLYKITSFCQRDSLRRMKYHRVPTEKLKFSRVRTLISSPVAASAATAAPTDRPSTEVGEGSVLEIAQDIFLVRCSCTKRLKFEVEYGLKRGTTENSYLILGTSRESTVLIDIPVESFQDSFIVALQKTVLAKKIGKIVLTHLDPKSVPVLKHLLSLMNRDGSTPVEIIATSAALRLLEASLTKDGVRDTSLEKCELKKAPVGGKVSLEEGKLDLECVRTATPLWPDMLCIYIPQRKILFSSKLFAAHVAPQLAEIKMTPFDVGGWETYGNDWKFYFDTMLAPSSNQVFKALIELQFIPISSISPLPLLQNFWSQVVAWFSPKKETEGETKKQTERLVAGVCPMHGPVIKNSLNELLGNYFDWLEELKTTTIGSVAVFYASAYGNTAALAQALSHGISKTSVGVETINLEIAEPAEILEVIRNVDGFIMGSPTLGGHMPTQVQSALGTILRESKAKELPCGVFGSFGWSGEAVDEMSQRLKDGGFAFSFDPIKVKFKPTTRDLQLCEESGTDLAQAVIRKLKKSNKLERTATQARMASGAAQAIGRVVGTLCVISGKDGDAESGMLASWISQASFDPPGLTVAVKRDRALENVMMVENRFVVNILPEGKERELVKHMLKPFKPGEDRFAGLASTVSSETGCVILDDAVSFLECTVKERMEAGDHWIVYATVDGGEVLDKNNVSAVHHRTVGTNY